MKRETFIKTLICAAFIGFAFCLGAYSARAQTTTFTYQEKLSDGAMAANGTYDLGFALFDAATGGTQIETGITLPAVNVSNGVFTVQLDFGANPFASGANRFLEIAVKRPADADFTTLTPRQQLTSSPFTIQSLSAKTSDGLSANCVGCVTNSQITSIAGAKVTGTVSNAATANSATTATTAGNVTGVVAIVNGGTGSATKNFVDTTNAQTVGGNKTFNNTVTTNTLNAGGGGLNMNDRILRVRDSGDSNHAIIYNTTVDGIEFRGFNGFRWATGTNGVTERMRLDGLGNLMVSGNITTTGTLNGTLANNSIGTAQVADGSLRVSDMAINSQLISLATFSLSAHSCATLSLTGSSAAVGDLITVYLANNTPAGFYVQPTIFTTAGSANVIVCNTLNGNNVFPTQSLRVVITRP